MVEYKVLDAWWQDGCLFVEINNGYLKLSNPKLINDWLDTQGLSVTMVGNDKEWMENKKDN